MDVAAAEFYTAEKMYVHYITLLYTPLGTKNALRHLEPRLHSPTPNPTLYPLSLSKVVRPNPQPLALPYLYYPYPYPYYSYPYPSP